MDEQAAKISIGNLLNQLAHMAKTVGTSELGVVLIDYFLGKASWEKVVRTYLGCDRQALSGLDRRAYNEFGNIEKYFGGKK